MFGVVYIIDFPYCYGFTTHSNDFNAALINKIMKKKRIIYNLGTKLFMNCTSAYLAIVFQLRTARIYL